MIDFYYWPTPNGWKVSILLEELGIEYRTIPVNIGKGDQFKPDFLAISPNNRMDADGRIHGHFTATGIRPRFLEELVAMGVDLPGEYFDPSRSQ